MAKVVEEDKVEEDDDYGDGDSDDNGVDDVSSLIASTCLKSKRNFCAAQELRVFLSHFSPVTKENTGLLFWDNVCLSVRII